MEEGVGGGAEGRGWRSSPGRRPQAGGGGGRCAPRAHWGAGRLCWARGPAGRQVTSLGRAGEEEEGGGGGKPTLFAKAGKSSAWRSVARVATCSTGSGMFLHIELRHILNFQNKVDFCPLPKFIYSPGGYHPAAPSRPPGSWQGSSPQLLLLPFFSPPFSHCLCSCSPSSPGSSSPCSCSSFPFLLPAPAPLPLPAPAGNFW